MLFQGWTFQPLAGAKRLPGATKLKKSESGGILHVQQQEAMKPESSRKTLKLKEQQRVKKTQRGRGGEGRGAGFRTGSGCFRGLDARLVAPAPVLLG